MSVSIMRSLQHYPQVFKVKSVNVILAIPIYIYTT